MPQPIHVYMRERECKEQLKSCKTEGAIYETRPQSQVVSLPSQKSQMDPWDEPCYRTPLRPKINHSGLNHLKLTPLLAVLVLGTMNYLLITDPISNPFTKLISISTTLIKCHAPSHKHINTRGTCGKH